MGELTGVKKDHEKYSCAYWFNWQYGFLLGQYPDDYILGKYLYNPKKP